jgi:hypothetical protein
MLARDFAMTVSTPKNMGNMIKGTGIFCSEQVCHGKCIA